MQCTVHSTPEPAAWPKTRHLDTDYSARSCRTQMCIRDSPYIQQVIEGFIIVLAVAFDVVSKSKKSQKVIVKDEKKEEKA